MNRIIARRASALAALSAALADGYSNGATFVIERDAAEPVRCIAVSEPTAGYCVGGLSRAWVQKDRPTAEDLAEFLTARVVSLPEALSIQPLAIGFWRDEATGKWWIDSVEVLADRREAIQRGLSRRELAIWDVAAGAEVRLDRPLPLGDILTGAESYEHA